MNELLHTERTYVADLKCIIQVRNISIPLLKASQILQVAANFSAKHQLANTSTLLCCRTTWKLWTVIQVSPQGLLTRKMSFLETSKRFTNFIKGSSHIV